MQITTESFINYLHSVTGRSVALHGAEAGIFSDEIFEVNTAVEKTGFSDDYVVTILLKQDTAVQLTYNLICTMDEGEVPVVCNNCLPFFNSKYLAPVLKRVATGSANIVLHANKNYAVTYYRRSSKSFSFEFLLDAPSLHPSWNLAGGKSSTANEIQRAGTVYTCNFSILKLEGVTDLVPAIPVLFPDAIKSGFILTDHCDFDTAEKLRVFLYGNKNDGWLNRGLKITKGVFTVSSRTKDFDKNDSLEDEDYLQLINELYADGSEIVPHALKSKGQLDKATYHAAMEKISSLFKPATWIDHGSYLKYCYSQGGKTNKDYMLVDTLKKYHYNNLWSFHDVNVDAINTLNIFTDTVYSGKIVWHKVFNYLLKGKWMIAAHHFRSIIHRNYRKNIFFDFLVYSMAQVKGSFIKWKTNKKKVFSEIGLFFRSLGSFRSKRVHEILPYTNEELLKYSEAVFTEERRPLAQYKEGDLLMFSTFETTHVKDIYTKAALDSLVAEYGLHIGHTYILNDLPYLANIFTHTNDQLQLSAEWIQFTEQLSNYVQSKLVWNTNMSNFIDWLKCLLNVEFKYISADKFNIVNRNMVALKGFTFIISAEYPPMVLCNGRELRAVCTDKNFHFFCIDLMPAQNIPVVFEHI